VKDILIITNYYPPEIGAASNRIFQLANGLATMDYSVSVVTPLPNYPHGKIFKGFKNKRKVIDNGITINRLWLYASNSKNKFKRLLAMLSYSFSLMRFFLTSKVPNTIIIQSPPLLVAFTSILFLKSKKRTLILNISDLWPLAGLKLGAFKKGLSYSVLTRIERYNYSRSNIILGQSNEILSHVTNIVQSKKTFLYRNFSNINSVDFSISRSNSDKLRICYAGLLGVAQGILTLCKNLDFKAIELHLYGEGAERALIENYIARNPDLPIVYHGKLSRTELHQEILQYDIMIIPLLKRIYGSVPSKIFEFAKLGLPILYFGGGEGEYLVRKHHLGWTATPGDYATLNEVIKNINPSKLNQEKRLKIKEIAEKEFSFDAQLVRLAQLLQ